MCKAAKQKSKEELLSIAEEIAFAKALAANDKSLRDRALKKLKKWLEMKSSEESSGIRFTEEGLMRLWKGLFYNLWMSDKPLVQEECVESISRLIHCFADIQDARKFMRCFFQSISQAWFGLDGHRMDKYLMLVRRFLRQLLEYLHNLGWEEDKVTSVCADLNKSLHMAPLGLNLHLSEIYLEELAKVGRGQLSSGTVLHMLKPFADFMATSNDTRLLRYVNVYIFLHLLRQSDEGVKHSAKFEIWKEMGFPEGDINVIQEASDEEFEEDRVGVGGSDDDLPADTEGGPLDPRAGNVDVLLQPLDFDAREIKEYLNYLFKRKDTTTKARKTISFICKKYEKFIEGRYPLGIHKVEMPEIEDQEQIIEERAQELLEEDKAFAMERQLYKKGRIVMPDAWEITTVSESNLDKSIEKSPANKGNWEVQQTKKRKLTSDEPIGSTMKKIKVTLDDSLLNLSINESNVNAEVQSTSISSGAGSSMPSEAVSSSAPESESESSMDIDCTNSFQKSNINRKVKVPAKGRKAKKAKAAKKSKYQAFMDKMKKLDELLQKQQEEKRQKIEQADRDWGLGTNWDPPNKEEEIIIPFTPGQPKKSLNASVNEQSEAVLNKTPSSGKKVEFALSRNTAQDVHEYKKALRLSPNVPFNLGKKPLQSALKSKTVGSPINPFYIQPGTDELN